MTLSNKDTAKTGGFPTNSGGLNAAAVT